MRDIKAYTRKWYASKKQLKMVFTKDGRVQFSLDPYAQRKLSARIRKYDTKIAETNNERARRFNGGKICADDIARQYNTQEQLCYYCRIDLFGEYEVDHRTPISKGGLNIFDNISCCCKLCNSEKSDKTESEWSSRWYDSEGMRQNMLDVLKSMYEIERERLMRLEKRMFLMNLNTNFTRPEEMYQEPQVQETMRELEQEDALEALAKALELSPRVLEPLIHSSREKHKKLVLTLEDAEGRQEFVLSN